VRVRLRRDGAVVALREGERAGVEDLHARARHGVVGQDGLARQVRPDVRVEARHAAAEEVVARAAYDERQARLVALYAVELPAAEDSVRPAARVHETVTLAEREFDEVVDDEDVAGVVRRDRLQARGV